MTRRCPRPPAAQKFFHVLPRRQRRDRAPGRGRQRADRVGEVADSSQHGLVSDGVGLVQQAGKKARDKRVTGAGGVDRLHLEAGHAAHKVAGIAVRRLFLIGLRLWLGIHLCFPLPLNRGDFPDDCRNILAPEQDGVIQRERS